MYQLFLGLALLISGCQDIYFEPDCPLEESVDELIEKQTGINLDLTPNSPESKEIKIIKKEKKNVRNNK